MPLNCATSRLVLSSVSSPVTYYSFQNTSSITELLVSKLDQLHGGRRFNFFPPSPHCPYVARDLLSGSVRQHTLALCHMSSLSMDTKASHSNGDLCCPPGDNAASLKRAEKRRCPSASIMEVFRVCAVFLPARPYSFGPAPKREL